MLMLTWSWKFSASHWWVLWEGVESCWNIDSHPLDPGLVISVQLLCVDSRVDLYVQQEEVERYDIALIVQSSQDNNKWCKFGVHHHMSTSLETAQRNSLLFLFIWLLLRSSEFLLLTNDIISTVYLFISWINLLDVMLMLLMYLKEKW